MVPEISLTPQMVDRFIARFGEEKIALLHSKLSVGERYDEWKRLEKGEAKIVIGARSAIFAPVLELGIVIIDEEHDASYKSDMTPKYNAKELALYLAKQKNIPLVLGSATPDLGTYYRLEKENGVLTLKNRANEAELPKVEVIDMKQELAVGNKSMISNRLYELIDENIKKQKQTILFLNRRGYSTFVMCRECGYTASCPKCNITLTYHLKQNRLKCHYCGYERKNDTECPECGSKNIRYFGTGTQKLEEQINKMFPEAKTIRMDIDTVTKKNSYETILNKFKNENIEVLIGTQMVVKGHHFPNVTLVRSYCSRQQYVYVRF
ncbi:MAG: primosomal protein N' [Clostridia bacterium]|nr:primosomal protein N' [Clostridia bacterium]